MISFRNKNSLKTFKVVSMKILAKFSRILFHKWRRAIWFCSLWTRFPKISLARECIHFFAPLVNKWVATPLKGWQPTRSPHCIFRLVRSYFKWFFLLMADEHLLSGFCFWAQPDRKFQMNKLHLLAFFCAKKQKTLSLHRCEVHQQKIRPQVLSQRYGPRTLGNCSVVSLPPPLWCKLSCKNWGEGARPVSNMSMFASLCFLTQWPTKSQRELRVSVCVGIVDATTWMRLHGLLSLALVSMPHHYLTPHLPEAP